MNPLPALPCYLNGEFTLLPDAKVSVLDRGFIFGDGVYEVVPVYSGHPFRIEHHMARLQRNLDEVRINNPHSPDQWRAVIDQLLIRFAASMDSAVAAIDQLIYIQVTRGIALRDHAMPSDICPTVFVMSNLLRPPSPAQRQQGVACITAHDFRWEKAHIKSVSLLGAVLARQLSADVGAVETVMFRGDTLSEAASSNVWVIKEGRLLGSPRDNLVLEGVRYGLIEDICREKGIALELRPISRSEVLCADELILSSATKEVLAITTLDGLPVGTGLPGPIYQQLYAGYQSAKQR